MEEEEQGIGRLSEFQSSVVAVGSLAQSSSMVSGVSQRKGDGLEEMAEETREEELGRMGNRGFLLGLRWAGRWGLGGQQGQFSECPPERWRGRRVRYSNWALGIEWFCSGHGVTKK